MASLAGRCDGLPLWVRVLDELCAWDRILHYRYRNGTRFWAYALRSRLMMWLIAFTGVRGDELIRLQLTGPQSQLVRDPRGRVRALTFPRTAIRRPARTVPLTALPALATMLELYVDRARPLLLGTRQDTGGQLILDALGKPYVPRRWADGYGRLRRQIFGSHARITQWDLRRMAFLALHFGFRRPFFEASRIVGSTPARLFRNSEHFGRYGVGNVSLLASDTMVLPREIDRVIDGVRRWLSEVERDLEAIRGSSVERPAIDRPARFVEFCRNKHRAAPTASRRSRRA